MLALREELPKSERGVRYGDNSRSVLPIVGYHIQQIVNELLMRPAGVPDDNDEADVAGENSEDTMEESTQGPAPQDVSVQTILRCERYSSSSKVEIQR